MGWGAKIIVFLICDFKHFKSLRVKKLLPSNAQQVALWMMVAFYCLYKQQITINLLQDSHQI